MVKIDVIPFVGNSSRLIDCRADVRVDRRFALIVLSRLPPLSR